jgi:TctA family transporter
MLESLLTALTDLMSVQHLSFMMLGILVGLVVGVLPALGGIAGMSLLIPFVYGMDKVSALAMLIGLVATVPTGDTFTSVLIGVPGAAGSQATILDGFPLARRGQAARALSAAFTGSALGGIFGALVLTFFVVVAKPVILAFGAGELFMLGILGLSVVGVLAGKNVARGIAAAGLGLMAGAVGAAPATGEFRLDLGIEYLSDGIPLVIIGLGMFALPELTDLMRRNQAIASDTTLGSGWLQGVKDTFNHWFLVLRCSVIGTLVGAIPGLGGGVVDWIAYGHAVQSAKDKSEFGKGDVRGVLAAETSNNSLQGGALLPTILFGIPGSGSTAIFLGGMVLLGIQPGPSMVTTDLHLTYTIAWTLTLASVIGALLCFLLAYPIAKLTYVPFNLLAPAVIAVVCFAAFQVRQSLTDLLLLFALGMFGLFMRRFGWPRSAFLVGFVLSPQIENYLYQAVQFYDWNFVTRPGVLIIAALSVVSLWTATRGRISETGEVTTPGGGGKPARPAATSLTDRTPQIAFALLVLVIFGYALITCSRLNFLGAVFPTTTAIVMLLFSAYLLWALVFGGPGSSASFDQEIEGDHVGDPSVSSVWPPVAWFALLFGLAGAFGFIIAITLFVPAFLMCRSGIGVLRTGLYTVIAVGLMIFAGYMLVLDFPRGLLQSYVELPWPLR